MALVDRTGRLIRFIVKPGNAAENIELPTLLNGVQMDELIADKAYDTDPIRLSLTTSGIIATIPSKSNRKVQYEYDKDSYKTRHLVENYFARLKQFRGIVTRYCKLGESFEAFISLPDWFLGTKEIRSRGTPAWA